MMRLYRVLPYSLGPVTKFGRLTWYFDQSRNRFYRKQSNPSNPDFDESDGGSRCKQTNRFHLRALPNAIATVVREWNYIAFFLNDSRENTWLRTQSQGVSTYGDGCVCGWRTNTSRACFMEFALLDTRLMSAWTLSCFIRNETCFELSSPLLSTSTQPSTCYIFRLLN